ncbi:MAG: chaperonin GroEL [Candidatus Hodgkinia cicadicola]
MKTMFSKALGTLNKTDKTLSFGAQARESILTGLNLVTSAVSSTMGPKGRNVIIVKSPSSLRITKDGATVASEIELQSSSQNVGALLVKEVTSRTNEFAGDGTTTANVLLNAIISEGLKAVSAGANPSSLKAGIEKAAIDASNMLECGLRRISTHEEYVLVATIAANGDRRTGYDVADALTSVGGDGIVSIEESKRSLTELEVVEGVQFDKGYVSHHFVTNNEKMTCELDELFVLLYDRKISSSNQLLPILESVAQSGRSLLIIADEIEGEALATLVLNKLRSNLKVLAVNTPGFGDTKKQILEDIALITGAQVISSEVGASIESATLSTLGCARRVVSSKDVTTIIDGYGSKADINARSSYLKSQWLTCPSEYERELLRERIARLSGGVAVIKVGGMTEVDVKERKDRVEDALNATKLAIADGVVAGGGVSLLQISKTLQTTSSDTSVLAGIEIFKKALQAPAWQIIANAGLDATLIISKLLQSTESDYGFDVMTGYYGSMFAMRIIDSFKVTKIALMCAASLGALAVNSNALITDSPKQTDITSQQESF